MLRFKKEDGSAFPDLKEIVLADIMTERTTTQCISEDAPLLSFTIEQGVIDPSEKKTNKKDFLLMVSLLLRVQPTLLSFRP